MDLSNSAPLAIVGMGCRLPGDAENPNKLWRLLLDGRSAWSEVPADRWNWKSFNHPHQDAQEAHNQRGGHFILQDIAAFDANFFGIPAAEANALDPQQRIVLETTYEALESAGISLDSIRGSDTAVYTATFNHDYETMSFKDTNDIAKYHLTGNAPSIVSNRISYIFDLKGPSVSVDTACSGGLVALHQACQSLRLGESNMAIVGGTNLILTPDFMYGMSFMGMLNSEGKSYSFDERGSGYGRGEGVASLIVKRLEDAIAAGDPIRAVIRNTGVNQDGKTNGITLPNGASQEALARKVYKQIGLDPKDTYYVEAHGTGTIAGDSAEVEGIRRVFCENRHNDLIMGSIKANIGHLEPTSGLAAVIKVVMVLERGIIPATPNVLNVKKMLNLSNIYIPQGPTDWPAGAVRRASIQNFGFGGTNAHAILESKESAVKRQVHDRVVTSGDRHLSPRVFVFSANTNESLIKGIGSFKDWITTREGDSWLEDFAHTLAGRRTRMKWRASVVASTKDELVSSLKQLRPTKLPQVKSRLVWLFTGQGAQWYAMGRELLLTHNRFTKSMMKCNQILRSMGVTWDLLEELQKEHSESRIDRSEVAQLASAAIQVSLVDLMHSFDIFPEAVLGHSSGEMGAAYAAGVLSREQVMILSICRSNISAWCKEDVDEKGAMMAVGLGETEVMPYVNQVPHECGRVDVACVNSPVSTTISGDRHAIEALKKIFDHSSVFARLLKVDTAYHSYHMKIVAPRYLEAIGKLNVGAPQNGVHIFSSVTGEEKLSGFGAEYWVKNLVSRVRYSDGLRSLCYSLSEEKNAGPLSVTFLELGPHPALAGPTRQILGDVQIPNLEMSYTSALVRNKDARITVLDMAGKLFQAGIHIDLQAANLIGAPSTNVGFESTPVVLTDLPPYSWDHSKTYWHESRLSKNYRLRRHPYHDLLGLRVLLGSICDPTWRHILTVDQLPWLKDHVVDGFVIFPGSGYLCMVIEAAAQLAEENKTNQNVKQFRIRNVHLIKALVIPESPEKVEVQLIMRTTGKPHDSLSTWTDFTIVSLSSQGHHSEHCTGSVMIEYIEEPIDSELSLENSRLEEEQTAWARRCMEECSAPVFQEAVYDTMRKCGNDYGPSFSNLTEFQYHQHSAEGLARIRVPDIVAGMPAQFLQPHRIHPTTLDTIAHSSLPVYTKHYKPGAMMPIRIGELCIGANVPNQPGAELIAAVELVPLGSRSAAANIVVFDETHDGFLSPVVTLSNMEVVVMGQEATPATSDTGSPRALTIDWVQDPDFLSDEVKIQKELDNALLSIIPDSDPELADILGSRIKQAIERLNSADVAHHVDSNLQEQLSQWIKRYATMKEGNCWLTKFMDISKNIMQVYRRASQYLEQFSQARGSLKVLEAGAGCGVATRSLIEALKKPEKSRVWGDYEIASDTSNIPSKLLEGCEKGLSYTSLNINQDPLVQGHAAGSYDVIILNSFLHLSASVTTTLASVHPLLKPGGVLIMVGTTGELAHNSIYGLLNDFWKGIHCLTGLPLPSTEYMNQTLECSSFSALQPASLTFHEEGQTSYCMISTAITKNSSAHLPVEIIASSSMMDYIAGDFSSHLKTVNISSHISELSSAEPNNSDTVYVILDDASNPLLANSSQHLFSGLTNLLTKAKSMMWVSISGDAGSLPGPDINLATGFTRVARRENDGMRLVSFSVPHLISKEMYPKMWNILTRIISINFFQGRDDWYECEYKYLDGKIWVPRLRTASNYERWARLESGEESSLEMTDMFAGDRHLTLQVGTPGLLNTLRFEQSKIKDAPKPDEIEIQARAYGVTQADVFIAGGGVDQRLKQTSAVAGIITAIGSNLLNNWQVGDHVCGFVGASISNFPKLKSGLVQRLPASMDFGQVASVLYALVTAYYVLTKIAMLRREQNILIHSAESECGQAAVIIARQIGARIFATVNDNLGRRLLVEKHGVLADNIFSIRSPAYQHGILRLTGKKGVDCILNCTGDVFEDTWACMADFGTFVEIAQPNCATLSKLGNKNATLTSFDLGAMIHRRSDDVGQVMKEVTVLLDSGVFRPISPLLRKPIKDINEVFLQVQSGRLFGKAVLEIDDHAIVKALPAKPQDMRLATKSTYVIAGGLGNLGQAICRLLAARGAEHLVVLSRNSNSRNWEKKEQLEQKLTELGAKLHVLVCDISNTDNVEEAAAWCRANLPPVRGIVQSAAVLEDRMLEAMDVEKYNAALRPKRSGTLNLKAFFMHSSVDFFIMLASAISALGTRGQANYAAGNTFQEALAALNKSERTNVIAINPGLVSGTDADLESPERRRILSRQGLGTVTVEEVISTIQYSISKDGLQDPHSQIIIGIDPSLLDQHHAAINNRLYTDILGTIEAAASPDQNMANGTIDHKLSAAKTPNLRRSVITEALVMKLAELVAVERSDVAVQMPLAHFGLDSLVAIELKNWIGRTFKVAMQTSEILDSVGLLVLAEIIEARWSSSTSRDKNGSRELAESETKPMPGEHGFKCCRKVVELPKQPLLDLESILHSYLEKLRHFLTEEEIARTTTIIEQFKARGHIGRRLYDQLADAANNPNIDNWLYQIYLETCYTARRYPLAPFSNIVHTHDASPVPHTQAERAAVIALSAIKFKQELETNVLEPAQMNGRPLCMASYEWLFNSFREPASPIDRMRKMLPGDYVAVLRKGHLFKVKLRDGADFISYSKARNMFSAILDHTDEATESWVGILTADDRDTWAEIRTTLKQWNPKNKTYIDMIEAAAFVICLDDSEPNTPVERMDAMMLNNGFNRWFDKSLEFIVCANGVSGLMTEHSLLDGMSIMQLNEAITAAILEHRPALQNDVRESPVEFEEYEFMTDSRAEDRIAHIRGRFVKETGAVEFQSWSFEKFDNQYFQMKRIPTKGTVEAVIQLATKHFFGRNYPCYSPVSMEHFHKGRPEIIQIFSPEFKAFCDSAHEEAMDQDKLRGLLFDAARSYSRAVIEGQQGKGYDRTLSALLYIVPKDEPLPEFFADSVYDFSRPSWVMTGSTNISYQEAGFVLHQPKSVWVQYRVGDRGALFSIVSNKGKGGFFVECLERAAKVVEELLDNL